MANLEPAVAAQFRMDLRKLVSEEPPDFTPLQHLRLMTSPRPLRRAQTPNQVLASRIKAFLASSWLVVSKVLLTDLFLLIADSLQPEQLKAINRHFTKVLTADRGCPDTLLPSEDAYIKAIWDLPPHKTRILTLYLEEIIRPRQAGATEI